MLRWSRGHCSDSQPACSVIQGPEEPLLHRPYRAGDNGAIRAELWDSRTFQLLALCDQTQLDRTTHCCTLSWLPVSFKSSLMRYSRKRYSCRDAIVDIVSAPCPSPASSAKWACDVDARRMPLHTVICRFPLRNTKKMQSDTELQPTKVSLCSLF